MAKTYRCRPSNLLGLEDPYSAWCIDEVVYAWGAVVDVQIEKVRSDNYDAEDKGAADRAVSAELERLLSDTDGAGEQEQVQPASVKGRFRDPAADFAAARALRRPK